MYRPDKIDFKWCSFISANLYFSYLQKEEFKINRRKCLQIRVKQGERSVTHSASACLPNCGITNALKFVPAAAMSNVRH